MIIKSYELFKIDLKKNKFILFYGKNNGFKQEELQKLINKSDDIEIFRFEEKQILENQDILFNEILSKSLFKSNKIIIIKNCTDKILKIMDEIFDKDANDVPIILNSDILEKKSKLRSFFEKEKYLICVPFYPDTILTLSKIVQNFLKLKNISISQANVNLIINRCNGDRLYLKNELEKIELYLLNKKDITTEELIKLTNLTENHNISELLDYCLIQNKKKIISILNENNFASEEAIILTKILLNKAKKILKLSIELQERKNIDLVINEAKPPIFWKDKEIIKEQIKKWSPRNIKMLIYNTSKLELQIKKDVQNSINLITDFLLSLASSKTNN